MMTVTFIASLSQIEFSKIEFPLNFSWSETPSIIGVTEYFYYYVKVLVFMCEQPLKYLSAFFCDKDEFYMKWKISSKYLLKYFQKARSKNLCKQEKLQKQLLYKQFERKWQNARFSTFFREITGLHKIHSK